MIVVLSILIVVSVISVIHYLFPLIQVVGDSMYPTYKDGEILVGSRLFKKSKLKVGEVIIYKSPTDKKVVIKRIAKSVKYKNLMDLYCLGDNSEHSYDSRNYGFISSKSVVCKVIDQRRNINNVSNN